MAKRNKGDGHFNHPVKLNNVPGDDLAEQKGKDVSKAVYDDRDSAGFRGGRLDDPRRTGR
jgi:hypothetical protein